MADDWIEILPTALPIAEGIAFVSSPASGGITVFLGTTRSERSPDGQSLLALDYEAYEQMALEQMRSLTAKTRQRWRVVKIVLLHRIGRVALAEPSVLIAVSTPHRGDAFEACRFLIDSLKADIAIWKKEVWSDGSATWVHPTQNEL